MCISRKQYNSNTILANCFATGSYDWKILFYDTLEMTESHVQHMSHQLWQRTKTIILQIKINLHKQNGSLKHHKKYQFTFDHFNVIAHHMHHIATGRVDPHGPQSDIGWAWHPQVNHGPRAHVETVHTKEQLDKVLSIRIDTTRQMPPTNNKWWTYTQKTQHGNPDIVMDVCLKNRSTDLDTRSESASNRQWWTTNWKISFQNRNICSMPWTASMLACMGPHSCTESHQHWMWHKECLYRSQQTNSIWKQTTNSDNDG